MPRETFWRGWRVRGSGPTPIRSPSSRFLSALVRDYRFFFKFLSVSGHSFLFVDSRITEMKSPIVHSQTFDKNKVAFLWSHKWDMSTLSRNFYCCTAVGESVSVECPVFVIKKSPGLKQQLYFYNCIWGFSALSFHLWPGTGTREGICSEPYYLAILYDEKINKCTNDEC